MATPFMVLDVEAARSLGLIRLSQIQTAGQFEFGMWGHWMPATNSATTTVAVDPPTRAATIVGTATWPAGSEKFMRFTNMGEGNALRSGLVDTDTQSVTVGGVFRVPTAVTGVIPLFGNIADTGVAGRGLYIGSGMEMNYRGTTITSTGAIVAANTWYWAAFASDANTDITLVLPGGRTTESQNTATHNAGPTQFAAGNTDWNSSPTGTGLDIAELFVATRALNIAELKAVFARSIARMANRGITVTSWPAS